MRLCMICKQQIEEDRINAIAGTRLCVEHGKEIEKFGGEFKLSAKQERTSKKTSFKVNYGGISTTTERNEDAIERMIEHYEEKKLEES